MINFLLSFLIVSFLGVGLVYGIDYSGIHRTFLMLNSTLVQNSVFETDENSDSPYFAKEKLENECLNFLGLNLSKYTNKFEVGFYYFNNSIQEYCYEKCNGVRISLKADLIFSIRYENAFIYQIGETSI